MIITALAIWAVLGTASDFAVIGPTPFPVETLTAAEYHRHVDHGLALPGMGQSELAPSFGSFGALDPEGASGLFWRTGAPPNWYGSPKSPTFGFDTWEVDGQGVTSAIVAPSGGGAFVHCPKVFGTRAKVATVQTQAFGGDHTFRVKLLPTGNDAPKLPVSTAAAGDWSVTLHPQPWMGPLFDVRYSVTVTDGEGSSFHVISHANFKGLRKEVAPLAAAAICSVTSSGALVTLRSKLPEARLSLEVTRLVPKKLEIRVRRPGSGINHDIDFVGPDGIVYAHWNKGWRDPISRRLGKKLRAIQIARCWISETTTGKEMARIGLEPMLSRNLRDGEILQAVLHEAAETRKIDMSVSLPRVIPSTPF